MLIVYGIYGFINERRMQDAKMRLNAIVSPKMYKNMQNNYIMLRNIMTGINVATMLMTLSIGARKIEEELKISRIGSNSFEMSSILIFIMTNGMQVYEEISNS